MLLICEHNGMYHLKIINTSQGYIYKYENLKERKHTVAKPKFVVIQMSYETFNPKLYNDEISKYLPSLQIYTT